MYQSNLTKLFPILFISMLWKPCFAGEMGGELEQAAPYNGVYIGADVGLFTIFNHISNSFTGVPPISFFGEIASQTGHFGINGGGILGYDYSIQPKIKLGIEGYINGTNISIAQSQNTTVPNFDAASTTTKQNYAWGFRALPGYEISPGLVAHLVLGYSNAQFTIKSPPPATGLGIFQPIVNDTFTSNGFQSGIGLTSIIYHNFSLRIDGLFTTYGAHSSPTFSYSNGPEALSYIGTFRSVLNTFEGDLTLSYKFA